MITTTRTFGDETLTDESRATPAPASRPLNGTAASTALMNRIYRRQRHRSEEHTSELQSQR